MTDENLRMNPEIKEQWVRALRSGQYTQGKDALKISYAGKDSYCCLGVLCDIAVKSGAVDEPVKLADGWAYGDDHDSSWSSLPRKVVEWAGLNNHFHRTDPWVPTRG
jgi:hypothetical protein